MFIGIPYFPYIMSDSILSSCHLSVNSYPCLTDVIATFHSLSVSGATISRYSNIVLIISAHIFFFSKKMACSSSVLAFIANTLNLIIKSTIFFFSYLKCQVHKWWT